MNDINENWFSKNEYEIAKAALIKSFLQTRKGLNLSQKDFGVILGIDRTTVSKIENGKKDVGFNIIWQVNQLVKTNILELIDPTLNCPQKDNVTYKRKKCL